MLIVHFIVLFLINSYHFEDNSHRNLIKKCICINWDCDANITTTSHANQIMLISISIRNNHSAYCFHNRSRRTNNTNGRENPENTWIYEWHWFVDVINIDISIWNIQCGIIFLYWQVKLKRCNTKATEYVLKI